VAGDLEHGGVPSGAVELHFRKGEPALKVALGARNEQRVAQHGANRGGEREGQPERDFFRRHPPEHPQERDVALGDGFVEPVLLKEIPVLGVADPRQVCVEQNRERALVHTGGEQISLRGGRDKPAENQRAQPDHACSAASARPRWLNECFVAESSSAKVWQ